MPRKSTKKTLKPVRPQLGEGVEILNAGSVLEDPITRTLETNYMPYAMSVIVSRALPEIDGFKPAHRKLLYTMYGMGLLKGARTKSANIVGSTMHLNPCLLYTSRSARRSGICRRRGALPPGGGLRFGQ